MAYPPPRFRALDSLRGIAAMLVVLQHLDLTPWYWSVIPPSPWSWLFAGRMAVILFFVLSGFVLALPYFRGSKPHYVPYLIKRACRLYLPYAFALLMAASLCWTLNRLAFTAFPLDIWTAQITPEDLKSSLLLTNIGTASIRLNQPLWSLIVEMRASLIFPLLMGWVALFGLPGIVTAWIGGVICLGLNAGHGGDFHTGRSLAGSFLLTVYYLPCFMMGILAAARLDMLRKTLTALPTGTHITICITAVALHIHLFYSSFLDWGGIDLLYGLCACYVIILCTADTALTRLLLRPVLLWLGDISYSLYLVHCPLIITFYYLLHDHMPHIAFNLLVLPILLLAAHGVHYGIERPSMALGRKFAGKPDKRNALPAAGMPISGLADTTSGQRPLQ